jgi:hypothetical protein
MTRVVIDPHPRAVLPRDEPKTIVLDLVQPTGRQTAVLSF